MPTKPVEGMGAMRQQGRRKPKPLQTLKQSGQKIKGTLVSTFVVVDHDQTMYAEASGLKVKGRRVKGNGDIVVFYKKSDGSWD